MAKMKFTRGAWIVLFEFFSLVSGIIAGTVYYVNHKLALLSIVLLWAALISCALVLRLKLINHHWTVRSCNCLCWLGAVSFTVFCIYLMHFEIVNPMPDPEPKYPHFTVSFSTADAPGDSVQLTNDFLRRKDFRVPFRLTGLLFTPLEPGQSNIVFVISVENGPDSPIVAEDLKLIMTLPKELACIAGQGWQNGTTGSIGYFGNGMTNAEQSWAYDFPTLLPGFATPTAAFQISPASTNGQIYFSILLRAKDCPAEQLTFDLMPFFLPQNFPPQKGFLVEGKLASPIELSFPIQEILKHLHK